MMVSPPHEDVVFNTDTEPVYEHQAALVSSPFHADAEHTFDISFAAEATDDMSFNETTTPSRNHGSIPEEALTMIEIEKTSSGFGFNIVGGTDNPHFPGDIGIYVSSVNPQSKSYGVIRMGDKILSFDGIDMTSKTHDEAVEVFRGVKVGHVAKMLVDREYLFLQEDRTQTPTASATLTPQITPQTGNKRNSVDTPKPMTHSESKGRLTSHGISAVIERIRGKVYEEEDAQSVTSYAPSTHSIIDDVPRTPRKPLSLLDPRNNSWVTEALYVSIGLGALTLSGYLIYRFIRSRK
ncbi:hypothetical protein CAEBREN_00603 [Caenorhabditis brenneri]|uniref:PDZ domain-containing protein n=1 Tax=Caenorhabditis brenneri TaxID=135651 RepID=G0PJR7_CAEBE|nr:hypothetical protein CAEBREN_00603 [Caenorhabditis brenneri]